MHLDTKQTARSAMTTHPEIVQSFIANARSAGLSEEAVDKLLDMDLEELQSKARQLQELKSQGVTSANLQE